MFNFWQTCFTWCLDQVTDSVLTLVLLHRLPRPVWASRAARMYSYESKAEEAQAKKIQQIVIAKIINMIFTIWHYNILLYR